MGASKSKQLPPVKILVEPNDYNPVDEQTGELFWQIHHIPSLPDGIVVDRHRHSGLLDASHYPLFIMIGLLIVYLIVVIALGYTAQQSPDNHQTSIRNSLIYLFVIPFMAWLAYAVFLYFEG